MRNRRRVGLDIGNTSIKCVEVNGRGRSVSVTAVGKAATPKNAVHKGALLNAAAVAEVLRALLQRLGVSGKTTVVGLNNPDVVVKRHRMPDMTDKELEKALEFELPELVAFPTETPREITYSFEVLNRSASEVEVLFVACRRNLVEPFLACTREAGLEAAVVDLQAFNWSRLAGASERVCYVDLGEEQTTLYVELNGTYKVYRMLPIGGFHFTQGIMQAFDCDSREAQRLKETQHIDYLLTEGAGQKSPLRSVFQQYIAGILQTLDFIRAEERASHIREVLDAVYLLGGLAHVQGLQAILEQEIDLKVTVLNPFQNLATADGVEIPADYASYASALALAVRGVEE
ncbi:MAG: type IV pilus assembly protein PilM [Limnochordia bacterium]